jgi:signal transduction histidine kinase
MLYAQAGVVRSRALTILGTVYLYTGLLLVPHALTFPYAFVPNGLFGAGFNSTPWIVIFRQVAFPTGAILYIAFKQADSASNPGTRRAPGVTMGVAAAIAMAAAVTILTTIGQSLLPRFFFNRPDATHTHAAAFNAVILVLFVIATAVLFRKRSSVLDMWLLVALFGFLIQILLIMALHSRFTAGWYALYVLALFSQQVVTLALIVESNRLYARLAVATAARNREREDRLMSLDALAAAIAHEAGQPLTAIGIHAKAGLDGLTRAKPNVGKAIESLRAIIDARHRATDVIKSMRPAIARGSSAATEINLNDLVRSVVTLLQTELDGGKVALELNLDEALPSVLGDRVKLQRVLVNLFTNAIESLAAIRTRPRRIVVRSALSGGQDVLIEINDNGGGIEPEHISRIFDAFFTTKSSGTGLGLWLSCSIVEGHGGRLWASRSEPNGATFHLQIPRGGG